MLVHIESAEDARQTKAAPHMDNVYESLKRLHIRILNRNAPVVYSTLIIVLGVFSPKINESINIGDLSSILNLNEYYFCRIFKKIMGSTATDYINFVRTYYAKKLLFTILFFIMLIL